MCPPSFIEIASKEDWNLTNVYNLYDYYYYCAYNNNSEDETTQQQDPIPLLGEWDNNRETTQKQDPIPLLGEWDNNNNSEDETTQKQDPIPLAHIILTHRVLYFLFPTCFLVGVIQCRPIYKIQYIWEE